MIKRPQFVHYRALEEAGEKLSRVLRVSPYGGVTLFVFPFPFDETQVGVGWSACSPADQFNRGIGRKIAEGRITKLRQRELVLIPNDDKVLWLRLDRIAAMAWFEAFSVAMRKNPDDRLPYLQRGGSVQQLVAPLGSVAYPWLLQAGEERYRITPAGIKALEASQSDDLDSDE